MFSKFPTFRRKDGSPQAQKGRQKRFSRFISESHSKEAIIPSTLGASHFSSESLTDSDTASEVSHAQPVLSNLDASPLATLVSDENSSTGSFGGYSTYDSKESLAASPSFPDEIDVGLSVLHPFEDAEEQFLQDHEGYFLNIAVDNVRKNQYPELELQKIVYLDYATCALFSRYQVEQHMRILFEQSVPFLVSNSTTFYRTAQGNSYVNGTYEHLLDILNTTQNDYSIIFTAGLSSCYRLFGEMHHFQKGSVLLVGHDNHESVQHILHAATRCSARIGAIPLRDRDLCIPGNDIHKLLKKQGWSGNGCGLLVYPAQSCSSGVRHSLNWIVDAQQNHWKVLLDVSSCLPMIGVDLSLYQPEFVIGSFQQMVGYPENLGFLLVRRSSHSICNQKGSAQLKIVESPETGKAVHVVTEGEILSLHTFAALSSGLEYLESVGLAAIQKRVEALAAWLVKTLKSLRHKLDDKPLLQLYGSLDKKYRGSILTFNVLDPTGSIFPSRLIQRLAERSNIFLGTSSLHNSDLPRFLSKSDKKVDVAGPKASTLCLPVVRLSLGPVSTFDDIYRLVQFLLQFREEDYMSSEAAKFVEEIGDEC